MGHIPHELIREGLPKLMGGIIQSGVPESCTAFSWGIGDHEMDVTGSMGHIPHELIREGLPKLMGGIIQSGVPE
ncbi:hypothetical protein BOQ60_26535, partial [Chryseobacterium sp. CH1]